MNADGDALLDELMTACLTLAGADVVSMAEADKIARLCALLGAHVADAYSVEDLVVQRLVNHIEESVLSAALAGRGLDAVLPGWPVGDMDTDRLAWQQTLRDLARIRGQGA